MEVHIGPLEAGPDGIALKPKFNFGIRGGVLKAMVGVRDVRNGLAAEAAAGFVKSYATKGSTLQELLSNVQAQERVPALDNIVEAVPNITAAVAERIGVDLTLNKTLEGVVYLYVGVGVTGGVYLGWVDLRGYRMVGLEGAVAGTAGLAFTVRMGVHRNRRSVRLVCFFSNVGFDVVIHLDTPLPQARVSRALKS